MTQPLVSIILPTYQSERTLGAALSSALTQTYPHIEIVVCIDGATDRSRAIAEAYGDLVTVVVQENQGVSAARNAAIRAATGELVALLDPDDELLPPCVERMVARYQEEPSGRAFITTNAVKLSRHGFAGPVFRKAEDDPARARMRILEGNTATCFTLFPRAMWEEIGGYATELRGLEDWDFWTRAVFHGWVLGVISEPLAIYRLTPGSLSSQGDMMEGQYHPMRAHVLATVGDRMTPEERAFVELQTTQPSAGELRDLAAVALAEGDVPTAAARMREASRVAPSDRGTRLKAALLHRVPLTAVAYRWREQRRMAAQQR